LILGNRTDDVTAVRRFSGESISHSQEIRMTLVIRITLSILAIVTVVTFSADADAQIFRRLRDNIRANTPPQAQPAPQLQRPTQVAPAPQGQYGQALTPYARLTPPQRAVAGQPPRQNGPTNPTAQPNQVNVRVVTYYDPRTGRTFQRRYVLPPQRGATAQAGTQTPAANSNVAGRADSNKPFYDKIPKPAVANPPQQLAKQPSVSVDQKPKFRIPAIRADQAQPSVVQTPTAGQQLPMPVLAGPPATITGPTTTSSAAVTPSLQASNPQVATTPSVAVTNQPMLSQPMLNAPDADGAIDMGSGIVIDTAVEQAAAVDAAAADAISIGSTITDDGGQVAYSVLEMSEDDASPTPATIDTGSTPDTNFEIEINSADEVEAFFGQ
jgi:hypothetical protein